MHRSIRLAAVASLLALVLPLATVQAAPARSVAFDVQTTLGSPSGGPFWATGPAVDDGVICADGWTTDVSLAISGGGGGRNGFHVLKSFICGDGSGAFLLKLEVRTSPTGFGTYSWLVVGGTGAYLDLKGSGTGYGLPADYGVHDLFFGGLH
jgi:hypothetical protein